MMVVVWERTRRNFVPGRAPEQHRSPEGLRGHVRCQGADSLDLDRDIRDLAQVCIGSDGRFWISDHDIIAVAGNDISGNLGGGIDWIGAPLWSMEIVVNVHGLDFP